MSGTRRHPYEIAMDRLAAHLNGVVSRGRLQAIAETIVDAIEAEATEPSFSDLIEKAHDPRYSDEWIGGAFRARLQADR